MCIIFCIQLLVRNNIKTTQYYYRYSLLLTLSLTALLLLTYLTALGLIKPSKKLVLVMSARSDQS
jgi:hypothetical protein